MPPSSHVTALYAAWRALSNIDPACVSHEEFCTIMDTQAVIEVALRRKRAEEVAPQ